MSIFYKTSVENFRYLKQKSNFFMQSKYIMLNIPTSFCIKIYRRGKKPMKQQHLNLEKSINFCSFSLQYISINMGYLKGTENLVTKKKGIVDLTLTFLESWILLMIKIKSCHFFPLCLNLLYILQPRDCLFWFSFHPKV